MESVPESGRFVIADVAALQVGASRLVASEERRGDWKRIEAAARIAQAVADYRHVCAADDREAAGGEP